MTKAPETQNAKEPHRDSEADALDEQARLERFMRAAEFVMRSTPPPAMRIDGEASRRDETPPSRRAGATAIVGGTPSRRPPARPMMPTLNDDGTFGDLAPPSSPTWGSSPFPASPSWAPPPPVSHGWSTLPPAPIPTANEGIEIPREVRPSRAGSFVVFLMTLTTIASLLTLVVYAKTTGASAATRSAATGVFDAPPAGGVIACNDPTANLDLGDTKIAPAPTLPPPHRFFRASAPAPVDSAAPSESASAAVAAASPEASPPSPPPAPKNRLDDAAKTANMLREQLSSSVH